jgi:hypothetical protein
MMMDGLMNLFAPAVSQMTSTSPVDVASGQLEPSVFQGLLEKVINGQSLMTTMGQVSDVEMTCLPAMMNGLYPELFAVVIPALVNQIASSESVISQLDSLNNSVQDAMTQSVDGAKKQEFAMLLEGLLTAISVKLNEKVPQNDSKSLPVTSGDSSSEEQKDESNVSSDSPCITLSHEDKATVEMMACLLFAVLHPAMNREQPVLSLPGLSETNEKSELVTEMARPNFDAPAKEATYRISLNNVSQLEGKSEQKEEVSHRKESTVSEVIKADQTPDQGAQIIQTKVMEDPTSQPAITGFVKVEAGHAGRQAIESIPQKPDLPLENEGTAKGNSKTHEFAIERIVSVLASKETEGENQIQVIQKILEKSPLATAMKEAFEKQLPADALSNPTPANNLIVTSNEIKTLIPAESMMKSTFDNESHHESDSNQSSPENKQQTGPEQFMFGTKQTQGAYETENIKAAQAVGHKMNMGPVEKMEKIVQQINAKQGNQDLTVKLDVGNNESVILGLKDLGKSISVEVRASNQGLANLLQSQKEAIMRHLQNRDVRTSIFVDPYTSGNPERRERRDQRQGSPSSPQKNPEKFGRILEIIA